MTDATPARGGKRPARSLKDILNSEAFRTLIYQVALAAAVVLLGLYLYQNVVTNLQRQSIATGFGFLDQVSQFEIGEKLIAYSPRDTYGRALLVGLLNTLTVSAAGIVVAVALALVSGAAVAQTSPTTDPAAVSKDKGFLQGSSAYGERDDSGANK